MSRRVSFRWPRVHHAVATYAQSGTMSTRPDRLVGSPANGREGPRMDLKPEPPASKAERKDRLKSARAFVFFVLGFAVFVNEAFFVAEIRIELIAASLALMGLPAVLKLDDTRRNGE